MTGIIAIAATTIFILGFAGGLLLISTFNRFRTRTFGGVLLVSFLAFLPMFAGALIGRAITEFIGTERHLPAIPFFAGGLAATLWHIRKQAVRRR